ncbi:MAG TPA: hypothetical protein VHJ34_12165 [Actinomycetota bacterium]|nr:hypothetical protein [Actinomycetota bacterium]
MAARQPCRARVRATRRSGEPAAVVIVVAGRVAPADAATLCERVGALVRTRCAGAVVCDMGAAAPDLGAVDLVARVHLVARRFGARATVRRARPELVALLALAGLGDVVALEPLRVEARRQPEQREQRLGVEEERDPGDRAV